MPCCLNNGHKVANRAKSTAETVKPRKLVCFLIDLRFRIGNNYSFSVMVLRVFFLLSGWIFVFLFCLALRFLFFFLDIVHIRSFFRTYVLVQYFVSHASLQTINIPSSLPNFPFAAFSIILNKPQQLLI